MSPQTHSTPRREGSRGPGCFSARLSPVLGAALPGGHTRVLGNRREGEHWEHSAAGKGQGGAFSSEGAGSPPSPGHGVGAERGAC